MKTCTLCKIAKPLSEFGKHAQKKDGLSSWCKPCARLKANKRANRPEVKARKRAYDKARNKQPEIIEKSKAYDRKRYASNKEAIKERVRRWQELNPDKVIKYKKNNKYKRREIINSSELTTKELSIWENTQIKICSYCNTLCNTNYQVDHIVPLSTGGSHSIDNLTIACPSCNRSKSNAPLITWLAMKQNT